jgi:putative membrane-bound dehydrogenase-like protein
MPTPLLPRTLAVVALLASWSLAATTEPTIRKEDLPRVPPTEPLDAIRKFSVRPGFHVELVAAEPEVMDPIACCFDENGRMFVLEMRDYSERREERLGRVRMLEDVDGDGRYEKATIFLKDLAWPTAILYCNGGVLVGATPDIIFAKDTNGDGVADTRETLFTGFASTQEKLNVQGLFNNFQWGLDNRIHGCSGTNGGMVFKANADRNHAFDVRGKGFVIDPQKWSLDIENGGGQYGLSFDHTGRLFTCSNSVHIETFMYDARYAANNPYAVLPDPRICPAVDGPAAEVYRTSPEEPWRVIRTRWRVSGVVPGMIEGGGRSAGYFTGATGVTIYRGDAFGPDYVGDAFTGDAGGNLVHHKRLRLAEDGVEPVAERPADEKKIEFCSSSDNWFRPVDFANSPDGSLLICDMYRETIEHPWSIPPSIKQFLDLNSGNDRGRIWRLAPDGFIYRKPPKLSKAPTAELVALLEHPNGWHRETAARLLFERQDKSAVPMLASLLNESKSPLGRLHALHALDGLGGLNVPLVSQGMSDADAIVRAHAISMSEKFPGDATLREAYSRLAKDPDARVRYQLAWTLGAVQFDGRAKLLAELVRSNLKSKWMRAAVAGALRDGAGEVFAMLAAEPSPDAQPFLEQLADMIGAKHDEAEVKRVVATIHTTDKPFAVARALAGGAARNGAANQVHAWISDIIGDARTVALDAAAAKTPDRIAAIPILAYDPAATGDLLGLLSDKSQSVQLAALAALDRADADQLAATVVSLWPALSPRVQSDALAVLLKRPQRTKVLLASIRANSIPPTALNSTQVAVLHKSADAELRAMAKEVLPPPPSREQVVETFKPAIALTGDATRGRAVYQKLCVSCHRAGAEGHALGPDFVTVKNSGREKLLLSILDPNHEVRSDYIAFLIDTKDGASILGVMASDTPSAITVREAYGKETVIPRSNIKRMASQGKSLMPEGLEQGLKAQDLADLMTFVESTK